MGIVRISGQRDWTQRRSQDAVGASSRGVTRAGSALRLCNRHRLGRAFRTRGTGCLGGHRAHDAFAGTRQDPLDRSGAAAWRELGRDRFGDGGQSPGRLGEVPRPRTRSARCHGGPCEPLGSRDASECRHGAEGGSRSSRRPVGSDCSSTPWCWRPVSRPGVNPLPSADASSSSASTGRTTRSSRRRSSTNSTAF